MGLSDTERRAERSMSRKPERNNDNRSGKPAIAIFMQPLIDHETKTLLHCMFCGHPYAEVRNKVLYVSAYGGHFIGKIAADELVCKRCKQRYTKIV